MYLLMIRFFSFVQFIYLLQLEVRKLPEEITKALESTNNHAQ